MIRNAKIVATIGPASDADGILTRMIRSGMDVARLNFSHGTHAEHAARIQKIRELSVELRKPIAILQDLQGPKLRVGKIPNGAIDLRSGDIIFLGAEDNQPETPGVTFVSMDIPNLQAAVSPGGRILMDDGKLELIVREVHPDGVSAQVVIGGKLSSNKGVNLPGAALHFEGFTEKDREDLAFGLEQGVDYVAISFVRNGADVEKVRQAAKEMVPARGNTPIIAKLELPEAITNLHEIIHATDGVMVARGDLGVETSPSLVPAIQKEIIRIANEHAKPVITATQMLESMITNPRPTRAEASDVANAVFDGTDAVMLSAETASGAYPAESVAMMADIIKDAEAHYDEWGHQTNAMDPEIQNDALSITQAARELAHDRDVAAITVFTESGRTALYASKARPRVPILAFTPSESTLNRLPLLWGVTPIRIPYCSTVETMITHVEAASLANGYVQAGQQIILVSGFPVGRMRQPNFALLHTLGRNY